MNLLSFNNLLVEDVVLDWRGRGIMIEQYKLAFPLQHAVMEGWEIILRHRPINPQTHWIEYYVVES